MNILPDEVLDIIFTHYWQYKFNDVLDEIKKPLDFEIKNVSFIKKNFKVIDTPYKSNYTYHLKKINKSILEVIKNKGLFLICKYNKLLTRYITNDYLNTIFKKVPEEYKCVSAFFILMSGSNRYNILHSFEHINYTSK